jgi:hypothetical protein
MHRFKIKNFPVTDKQLAGLPFGRQVEHIRNLNVFKENSKRGWLGTKHKSVPAALKEFIDLYRVTEYFFVDKQSDTYHDDSIEIWYKTA